MDSYASKLFLLYGALFALTGSGPVQSADSDFESTINVVDRGDPLTGIPSRTGGINPSDVAQAAQEKSDIFAAGNPLSIADKPLSIADTLLTPVGIDHSALSLSSVSGITSNLSSNVVGAVSQLSELAQIKKLGGLLGGILPLGGTGSTP